MTIAAVAPQTLLGPLLQSFFAEHLCSHKRVSPRTIESYRDAFLLLQYLQAKTAKKPSALSIADLDAPVILSFLEVSSSNDITKHNLATFASRRFVPFSAWSRCATRPVPA
jgi:integrase/recombinase XerD